MSLSDGIEESYVFRGRVWICNKSVDDVDGSEGLDLGWWIKDGGDVLEVEASSENPDEKRNDVGEVEEGIYIPKEGAPVAQC